MTDNVRHKREAIRKVYPQSKTWNEKVGKMSKNQVIAIFMRFSREGKI